MSVVKARLRNGIHPRAIFKQAVDCLNKSVTTSQLAMARS